MVSLSNHEAKLTYYQVARLRGPSCRAGNIGCDPHAAGVRKVR